MGEGQGSQVSSATVWKVGLNLLAIVGLLAFLYWARQALLLIVISLIATLALNPIVHWLEGHKISRKLAVLNVFLVGTGLLVLALFSFVPMLVEQVQALLAVAPKLLDRLVSSSVFRWVQQYGLVSRFQEELTTHAGAFAQSVFGVLKNVLFILFGLVTILVLNVFMLVYGGDIYHRGLDLLPAPRRERFAEIALRLQRSVGGYVVGALLVASIGGVIITITLLILGVPYFLPLGFAMVVLGVIPYIGPTLAALLIVGITLGVSGFKSALIVAGVFVAYQALENNLLQPLVQRRTIKMNPLFILAAMLIGTTLANVLGALLALPLAGAIQVIIQDLLAHRNTEGGAAP